jgi:hypothetical protein
MLELPMKPLLHIAFVSVSLFIFPVNLSFIFAASFLSVVRLGSQALLQVLVLALAGATCKCA